MRGTAISLLVLASACGSPRIPPTPPGDDPATPAGEVRLTPSATAPDVRLTGVWGTGPTDVWVAGDEGQFM